MQFSFTVVSKDSKTYARTGTIRTPHGVIQTPAFSPVATRASVRSMSVEDLKHAGAQVVLANTYHLYLQPGIEVIDRFGGFGPFMHWDGPTITDSGGYQVSFLWEPKNNQQARAHSVKITDEGANFRSHIDGSQHVLTPELSMDIQHVLGADIIMAFDQPLKSDGAEVNSNALTRYNKEAFERTLRWEERSYKRWKQLEEVRDKGTPQALFGIIHGGLDRDMVQASSELINRLGFPGIAVGGEYIGSDPIQTSSSLDVVNEFRDFAKPLHALGLGGGPEGVISAVERGVDMFDNTSVTRMARSGLLFVYPNDGGSPKTKYRIDISQGKYKFDDQPVSLNCTCYTCQNIPRAYLNHLFKSNELLAYTLSSIHNIHYINSLMSIVRSAIDANTFSILKREWIL